MNDIFEFDVKIKDFRKGSYTEISLFDIAPNDQVLKRIVDPFNVYPDERTSNLLNVIHERRDDNEERHNDMLADNMGEGYDKEDPFIDDSDAPQIQIDFTTQYGGFYISKGNVEVILHDNCKQAISLPDNLPNDLREKIIKFKKLNEYLNDVEYMWVYEPSVRLLKHIDTESFNLNSTMRGRVLSYLSNELQMKKQRLIRKLKNLRQPSDGGGSSKATAESKLNALKSAISRSLEANPKKKFEWSEESSMAFRKLVESRTENETYDQFYKFLEEIVNLWPNQSIISTRVLWDECESYINQNLVEERRKRRSKSDKEECVKKVKPNSN